MMSFRFNTDQEIEKIISDFWEEAEYLMRIRILLRVYPKFNITELENRNVEKLWKSLSLEQKKNIYSDAHKYQISQI